LAIVDFLAIAPTIVTYAVPTLSGADLRFVRAVRLFRIFRLLKIGRYSDTLQHLGTVLIAKREELVLSVCIALVLLVLCSSGMYLVERNAQPEKFGSIPAAMWWGVSTLTTVGYGDVLPTTVPGKFLGAAIAIIGVGMFALPAGILAGGFNEALSKRKRRQTCPHCGKSVDGEG
ncbi:MAG: ion transporter, partial [Planctomycetota bacterium]|nr:ion transporter [Planctomycetota bacterium]